MDKCQPFQLSSFGDSSLKNYTCASGTGNFAFCFSREFFCQEKLRIRMLRTKSGLFMLLNVCTSPVGFSSRKHAA